MEQTSSSPLVSIGLAVYNGDVYLEEAICSILSQTYPHFELIISDNASTDRTAEICAKYVEKDSRVQYSRNATNIGGANNENRTFRLAKGKYFRWAAHDDVCAPELIEKCVQVLEERPDVVICNSMSVLIDEHGQPFDTVSRNRTQFSRPSQRFAALARLTHNCEETYGLIRSDVLRKTGLQRNYTDSDRTLLAQLSLYGQFYQIPEKLFYKRVHQNMSTNVFPDWRQRMLWFGDQYNTKATMPYWAQFLHYCEVIIRAPISLREKLSCFAFMVEWVARHRRWWHLGEDLVLAGYNFYHKMKPFKSKKALS